jgi:hypothetical protein
MGGGVTVMELMVIDGPPIVETVEMPCTHYLIKIP